MHSRFHIRRIALYGLLTCIFTLGAVPGRRIIHNQLGEPALQRPAQLYVADSNGVEGYPFINHHPKPPADVVYHDVGAPVAVGPDGSIYVSSFLTVFVYPPGSPISSRALVVKPKHAAHQYEQGIDSMVVDRKGNLYVGFVYTYWRFRGGATSVWSVYVYRPDASGTSRPFRSLVIHTADMDRLWCHWFACHVGGLALDAHGSNAELWVAWTDLVANPAGCDCVGVSAYSDPTKRSGEVTRSIVGSGVSNPYGLAIDDDHELYVDNPGGTGSFVAAYSTANGNHQPDRIITVDGEQSFGTGIAIAGQRLFIPDSDANAVYEVSSQVGGAQEPAYTLAVPSPGDVAVGS